MQKAPLVVAIHSLVMSQTVITQQCYGAIQ